MNDEQKAAAVEQLKRDRAASLPLEELVKRELQIGTNPKWVSVRYGVDLERCERYAAALQKQREKQLERQQESTGSDSPLLEGREVVNGT